ncbi:uncharacterized protein LOC114721407 [Neltuma alba]|uniref:uncharacterized protein LOC114721407 n=1 Tax=Neltuma alba TaxID=207710 RepID=UPI0010A4BB38|nr:uncharacterized protein LOC114721407 [Prosopis alba]
MRIYFKVMRKKTRGSTLKDEEQARDLDDAVINSTHSLSSYSTRSITDSFSDVFTTPKAVFSPEISVQQINRSRSNDTSINIPMTPTPASSPHEHNKLGFIVFPVELLNAIISLAVSSKAKDNQVLIYVAVACSTLAFSISSTALVVLKKRPPMAKKMQKAAFLIGTFGFLGMMGMLLPSSISWWFTISAFLVCVLMFAVANLIGREEPG